MVQKFYKAVWMHFLLLKGDGESGFTVRKFSESGFYVPGDAKALTYVLNENGDYKVIATQNREKLKAYP